MEEMTITLYDNGKPVLYRLERIFSVDGTEQQYCAAAPVNGGDVIFLRCTLSDLGENTEVMLDDITTTAEYIRVTDAYKEMATKDAVQEVGEELSDSGDFVVLDCADGTKRGFIVHTIFSDESGTRSYVALQPVDDNGNASEEISLYLYVEEDGDVSIDMIPSDMEYDRARNIFMKLIENS